MLRFLVCVCGSYMDVVRSPLANVFGLTLGPVLPRHFQDWHSSAQNIDSQRNANVHGKVGRATRRRDIVSRPRLLNLLGIIEGCPYLTPAQSFSAGFCSTCCPRVFRGFDTSDGWPTENVDHCFNSAVLSLIRRRKKRL